MHCPACGGAVGLDVLYCGTCGAAVGPRCPRCARQCRTGERFCALCGAELDAGDAQPEHLRRAERKLVTVVFVDMVGFTSLGHAFDPETVREAMTSFFRALAGLVRAHGGYVEKYIGDAMMSVFGAPVSREDDCARAIETAIEMHRVLDDVNAVWSARLGRTIQIRVGINTGIAVAGPIGEGRATDYGVCGDVVNTAQRLESAAEPGQTIVGEQTRELAGRAYLFQPIPPLTLKGKPEPVPAFRLLGRAEAVTELFGTAPLIGRDGELGHLRAIADLVRAGGRAAVAVQGETGSGKSRLLRALGASPSAEDFRQVWPRLDGAPLGLVRAIARSLGGGGDRTALARRAMGGDDALATGLVDFLLDDEPPADSPVASLDAAARAELLAELLAGLISTSAEPVLIALDGPEAADGASLRLLAQALDLARAGRWLVVTASGTAWTPPWPVAATVVLGELGAEDMRAVLAAAMGDEELPEEARDALVEAAAGNPLALTELAWAYRSTGRLPRKRAGGVAGTILALVQSRIDAVDEDAKRVLQVGAVVGPSFDLALVEAVAGGIDVAAAVERLKRRNLLVGGAELRFPQAVIRSVAYDGLLLAERRRLHTAVADALAAAGVDDPIVLAHHHGRGDDDAAAVAALARAAEAQLALGDPSAALAALRSALERLGDLDALGGVHRAELLGRVGDVLALRGDLDGAAAALAEAADRLDAGLLRAELHRRRALVEHRRGDDDAALDALQLARDDVTLAELAGDEPVEAVFTALAAMATAAARVHLGGGRSEEASWEARQAIEMLSHLSREQAAAATARRPMAEANLILAEAALLEGEPERAAEHADDARVAYEELRDLAGGLRADLVIARARAAVGAHAEARARLEAALALARRLGDGEAVRIAEEAMPGEARAGPIA